MNLYEPLGRYLARASDEAISMSYADIERVLGRPLPPSAHGPVKRSWWANTDTHSQARAWLSVGRKAKLDVRTDTVTFLKIGQMDDSNADIRLSRRALEPAAVRLIEDYAEEKGVDFGEAVTALLNQAALRRRKETLDWFAQNTAMSTVSSAELVRADRDGR